MLKWRMRRKTADGLDSRNRIIRAAVESFAQKGKHGARMEEIAAKADVNQAMVYYYYSSKDFLFRAVLVEILRRVYDRVFDVLGSEEGGAANHTEKLARLVSAHLTAFSENTSVAKILLHALSNEPGDLKAAMRVLRDDDEAPNPHLPEALLAMVEEEILKKEIRELDPQQVLISIIGMCLICFIGKPISETLLNRKVESDEAFLRERAKSIVDMVLDAVRVKTFAS